MYAALSFQRDPDSKFDKNAIAVHHGKLCTKGTHIGYLPRDTAEMVGWGWAAGRELQCTGTNVAATLISS